MEGSLAPVYDRFLDFLVEKATPQEILSFTIPESERGVRPANWRVSVTS